MGRGAPADILRLAKVVSPRTPLLRDWATALRAGKPIRAFHDMTMAPVAADTVAQTIEALMADRATDIFQLSGPRDVTYEGTGHFLAERLGADVSLVTRTSVATAGLPAGIAPAHTTLESSALQRRYGIVALDAWAVIDEILPNL
jgi:dTDP-4-dehydrorhamnose reductase